MTDSSTPQTPDNNDNAHTTGMTPLHPVIPHIVVYTQPGCFQCKKIMKTLNEWGIPHLVVDVADDLDARSDLVDNLKIASTPVTVIHNIGEPNTSYYWTGIGPDQLRKLREAWPQAIARLSAIDTDLLDHAGDVHTLADKLSELITTNPTPDEWKNSTAAIDSVALTTETKHNTLGAHAPTNYPEKFGASDSLI